MASASLVLSSSLVPLGDREAHPSMVRESSLSHGGPSKAFSSPQFLCLLSSTSILALPVSPVSGPLCSAELQGRLCLPV